MREKGDYSECLEGSSDNLFKNIFIEAPNSDQGPTNLKNTP